MLKQKNKKTKKGKRKEGFEVKTRKTFGLIIIYFCIEVTVLRDSEQLGYV